MAIVFEEFLGKALEDDVILAFVRKHHPPRHQVGKHAQILVALAAAQFVHPQKRLIWFQPLAFGLQPCLMPSVCR